LTGGQRRSVAEEATHDGKFADVERNPEHDCFAELANSPCSQATIIFLLALFAGAVGVISKDTPKLDKKVQENLAVLTFLLLIYTVWETIMIVKMKHFVMRTRCNQGTVYIPTVLLYTVAIIITLTPMDSPSLQAASRAITLVLSPPVLAICTKFRAFSHHPIVHRMAESPRCQALLIIALIVLAGGITTLVTVIQTEKIAPVVVLLLIASTYVTIVIVLARLVEVWIVVFTFLVLATALTFSLIPIDISFIQWQARSISGVLAAPFLAMCAEYIEAMREDSEVSSYSGSPEPYQGSFPDASARIVAQNNDSSTRIGPFPCGCSCCCRAASVIPAGPAAAAAHISLSVY
ncbi:hypothetical protein PMAYCL1PPCAC_09998, partial [Pristionchus mayeri]